MNFDGLKKIFANTAAQIDKAVANKVEEVAGPKALSEYDMGDQIGSGGPGLLWKLFRGKPKSKVQQELSAEVCIWLLDKKQLSEERAKRGTSKAAEDALLDIFRSDAKNMQRLRHPGVVRVVETLDENKDVLVVVTEPLFSSVANALGNHENLPKIPEELRELELGQLEVKHGLLQLSQALAFLHKNAKIVHRSISPETVFLTTTGGWKFGGFGFSIPVEQVGLDSQPPFHYPDYDVEFPALPLQPVLDYSAPELIRKPIKSVMGGGETRTSCDIFSLALLTYHLVATKPLLRCYNNQQTYLNKIMNLHRDPLQGIPLDLENDLRRMLSQEAASRPVAHDFSSSPWYRDDIRLRALRFLDNMLERDNLQKTEFFKALNGLWPGFDPRVLRYKVLPPLLAELKNEAILQFTLPLILLIAEHQSPRDFVNYTQQSILPVLQGAIGEILLILVKHLPMLVSKASLEVMESHVLPMLVRAYDDGDPRIQEETLRRTVDLALKLDFDLLKAAILPRVHALALQTSIAAVRVHALICLGDLVQRLDRSSVMDVLQTCARCAAVDHSPSTLMCVLAVSDTIQKQLGVEFASEHILPLLTPILISQQLSSPQFAKYMRLVLDILKKIEEKRGVNLSEADSVSLDFAGLGASASTLSLTGPSEIDKVFSNTKPTTSWDETDDWGPIAKQGHSQNSVAISGFLEAPPPPPPSSLPLALPDIPRPSDSMNSSNSFSWSENPSPQPITNMDPFSMSPTNNNLSSNVNSSALFSTNSNDLLAIVPVGTNNATNNIDPFSLTIPNSDSFSNAPSNDLFSLSPITSNTNSKDTFSRSSANINANFGTNSYSDVNPNSSVSFNNLSDDSLSHSPLSTNTSFNPSSNANFNPMPSAMSNAPFSQSTIDTNTSFNTISSDMSHDPFSHSTISNNAPFNRPSNTPSNATFNMPTNTTSNVGANTISNVSSNDPFGLSNNPTSNDPFNNLSLVPKSSSMDHYSHTNVPNKTNSSDPFANVSMVTNTHTHSSSSSDPFASLTTPPPGPSMTSRKPKVQNNNPSSVANNTSSFSNNPPSFSNNPTSLSNNQTSFSNTSSSFPNSPSSPSLTGVQRNNMQMSGGNVMAGNVSGLGLGLGSPSGRPTNNINMSNNNNRKINYSQDPFSLPPSRTQAPNLSFNSNSTSLNTNNNNNNNNNNFSNNYSNSNNMSNNTNDPFSDWPPRNNPSSNVTPSGGRGGLGYGGSSLPPSSLPPTSLPPSGGTNLNTGNNSGMKPFGGLSNPSVNSFSSSNNPNLTLSSDPFGSLSPSLSPSSSNYSQYSQQQTDLDSFFSNSNRMTTPQSGGGGSVGRGGGGGGVYGNPNLTTANNTSVASNAHVTNMAVGYNSSSTNSSNSLGTGVTSRLALPPPPFGRGISPPPPSSGVSSGGGVGQVSFGQNPSSLPDLL